MKYTTLSLLILLCLASNCYSQSPMSNNPYQGLNQAMSSFLNSASSNNNTRGSGSHQTQAQNNMDNETLYSMKERNKILHTTTYFQMRQMNQYYQELEKIQRRERQNKSKYMTVDELDSLYKFNRPYGY